MAKRDDIDYEIEALSKGLAVLEALEGTSFEPVPLKRIMQRCPDLSRDTVMRTLKTLRLRGYARTNERGEWLMGNRILRLSGQYGNVCLAALAKQQKGDTL